MYVLAVRTSSKRRLAITVEIALGPCYVEEMYRVNTSVYLIIEESRRKEGDT